MTAASCPISRAQPPGSIAARSGRSTAASRRSRPGATRCWRRKNATSTSSTARSSTKSTGCATASPAAASATSSGSAICTRCATSGATYRGATGNANLAAAEADKSGKLVIEAKNIGKAYGDRTIVDGFSIRVQRGDRIGIVGPNGAGKTTLIEMLTGGSPPDSGTIRLGANIEMATLDQHRESLDPKTTLAEALTGGRGDHVMVGGKPKHVVSYMKDFLFAQEQMRTPLEVLSGGERGRLMLARALAKPSNLLVLDEPTNDLDLETLDVLEEMLGDYEGTVILISHDRDFLDRVVTSVIVPEGNGRWIEYAGGYTDMLAQRGEDLAARSAQCNGRRGKEGNQGCRALRSTKAPAELQREARAGNPAEDDGEIAGRDCETAEAA